MGELNLPGRNISRLVLLCTTVVLGLVFDMVGLARPLVGRRLYFYGSEEFDECFHTPQSIVILTVVVV